MLKYKKRDILLAESDDDTIYSILNKRHKFDDMYELTEDAETFEFPDDFFAHLFKIKTLNNLTIYLDNKGKFNYKIEGVEETHKQKVPESNKEKNEKEAQKDKPPLKRVKNTSLSNRNLRQDIRSSYMDNIKAMELTKKNDNNSNYRNVKVPPKYTKMMRASSQQIQNYNEVPASNDEYRMVIKNNNLPKEKSFQENLPNHKNLYNNPNEDTSNSTFNNPSNHAQYYANSNKQVYESKAIQSKQPIPNQVITYKYLTKNKDSSFDSKELATRKNSSLSNNLIHEKYQ